MSRELSLVIGIIGFINSLAWVSAKNGVFGAKYSTCRIRPLKLSKTTTPPPCYTSFLTGLGFGKRSSKSLISELIIL
jgi:hypothetical protein